MKRFVVLAALTALLLAPPASAELGDPQMSLAWSATDFGAADGRYFVSVACVAHAPGAQLVQVFCMVDGLYNES